MKFLPPQYERTNMLPLNITYYNPKDFSSPDVLTIVYKDQDTSEDLIFELKEPEIEIYIVKPERRNFNHMRDMIEMSECNKYKVKYRQRWSFAAKILKLDKSEDAKISPYVFNADIPIETYYLMQFVIEYPSTKTKKLSLGKLDIENDIIQCDGFPVYGETPINAVTYINMETNDVYTLILLKDNLPSYSESDERYQRNENLRKKFNKQMNDILSNPDQVIEKCHEKFDELYPGMKYNLLYYDEESKLLTDLFKIIHQTDNDYIGIWNSPYDMQNLMLRPLHLGMSPLDIIPDERFSIKMVSFKEDGNPKVGKRKHDCQTSTIPSFVDDMVHYAGIRSGGSVLESTRLNAIGKKELKDEKYDYSEVSDIKHLYYEDLMKFILYNIKDVLLLVGIERKTKDTYTIYNRMYTMCVFPKEAFTTTKVVWYSLIKFMYSNGYVPGTNRNRGNKTKHIIDYSELLGTQISDDMTDDEFIDNYFDIDDEQQESGESEKEEKYSGAYVMNTLHMKSTGFEILGEKSQFVHDNVADLDVGSEYPTGINIANISNETLVAKIYLENPDEIEIPIYDGFVFRGEDKEKYKMDKSNFLLEAYTEGDVFTFANIFLGLPTPDEVLENIKSIL